ncbi:MAG TPA: type II toxin-antitoxin system mRNA interferase toxin, RelE/StbE family [Nitrospira sp.]|nr:type II toxin-antitoxin system mRNA interferase toxin, RelE/StbE family [Nitrospira sp.]
MWRIEEHRRLDQQCASAPQEVLKRYEKWKDIATISGPLGLRQIAGFNDEALSGTWKGFRSSRLGLQYRIIYRAVADEMLFQIESLTAHDYRRR